MFNDLFNIKQKHGSLSQKNRESNVMKSHGLMTPLWIHKYWITSLKWRAEREKVREHNLFWIVPKKTFFLNLFIVQNKFEILNISAKLENILKLNSFPFLSFKFNFLGSIKQLWWLTIPLIRTHEYLLLHSCWHPKVQEKFNSPGVIALSLTQFHFGIVGIQRIFKQFKLI